MTIAQICKSSDRFYARAHQLNLFPPQDRFEIFHPIPASMVPTLGKLTIPGKIGGVSNMSRMLERVLTEGKRLTAIVAYRGDKIIGWAMINWYQNWFESGEGAFTIDIFVEPAVRQSGLGYELRDRAISFGQSKQFKYVGRDHFDPYKEQKNHR